MIFDSYIIGFLSCTIHSVANLQCNEHREEKGIFYLFYERFIVKLLKCLILK